MLGDWNSYQGHVNIVYKNTAPKPTAYPDEFKTEPELFLVLPIFISFTN